MPSSRIATALTNRVAGKALRRVSSRVTPLAPLLRAVGGPAGLRRAGRAVRASAQEAGGPRAFARELAAGTPALAKAVYHLARDPAVPNRYRWGLAALIPYLASPLDAIPVIGQAGDVAAVMLVLRWVGRGIGEERLLEHWHPSPVMLGLYRRIAATD